MVLVDWGFDYLADDIQNENNGKITIEFIGNKNLNKT